MSMDQAKRGAEHITGVPNVTYDLISVLYHKLEGIAAMEGYQRDAEQAGDREVTSFFSECERRERADIERLRGMLASRLAGGQVWAASETGEVIAEPQ